MLTMNIHEAKTNFSKLIVKVHEGEEVIIAKAGKPYAKLVPLPEQKRKPGIAKGRVLDEFFEPLSDELLDAWNH